MSPQNCTTVHVKLLTNVSQVQRLIAPKAASMAKNLDKSRRNSRNTARLCFVSDLHHNFSQNQSIICTEGLNNISNGSVQSPQSHTGAVGG